MKRFLKNIALFMIVPAVVVALIDVRLRTMNDNYKEKVRGLEACADSVEVLILGNSHSAYGVNPECFSMYAYNLASVNQSLYFDKRLTLEYLDRMTSLKYVLISLDYHSLYFSSQGSRDVWAYYGHGIPYKDNKYLKERISPFLFGYTPMVSATILGRDLARRVRYHGQQTLDFDVEQGVDITVPVFHGYCALDGTQEWKFNEDAYKGRLGEFWWTESETNEHDEVLADLEDFVRILQAKGIVPIFYVCPTYLDYNKVLNPTILAGNARDAGYLCDKFGVRYLNHMNDGSFSMSDFFNCDHLNRDGALKFSTMLDHELQDEQ